MLPHHLTPSPTPPICALFSPHLPPPPIIPAVEGYLEQALLAAGMMLPSNFGDLFKIGWSRSSRTDKGVHSVATVVSVKLELPESLFQKGQDPQEEERAGLAAADAINAHLPPSIRVFGAVPVTK
ncbi:unnamed protein product [Closterium sp. NIES-53]